MRNLIWLLWVLTVFSVLGMLENNSPINFLEKSSQSNIYLNKLAKDNPCFTNAVQRVQSICLELTHESRQRLSLDLMNCQLELSAKQKIPCETSDSISHCLSFVEGDAWTTYNGFYHHCEMICYTYQAILWQGDTNHFLKGLADNTLEVRSIVNQNYALNERMYERQLNLLDIHQENLEVSQRAHTALQEAISSLQGENQNVREFAYSVMDSFGIFKSSLNTILKSKIGETLSWLQWLLIHKQFTLNDMLFYLGSMAILYLVTGAKPIICTYIVEKVCYEYPHLNDPSLITTLRGYKSYTDPTKLIANEVVRMNREQLPAQEELINEMARQKEDLRALVEHYLRKDRIIPMIVARITENFAQIFFRRQQNMEEDPPPEVLQTRIYSASCIKFRPPSRLYDDN